MVDVSSLKDDNIKQILSYLRDARVLSACGKTCKRWNELASDDEVWKNCDGADAAMVESYRENAFIECVLRDMQEVQKSSHNYVQDFLTPEPVRAMVNQVIESGLYCPRGNYTYHLRGDSHGCTLGMIEPYIVGKVQQANLISVHSASQTNEYPTLKLGDLQVVDMIFKHANPALKILLGDISRYVDEDTCAMFGSIWDRDAQFQLARRIATRAGVVRITNEAMLEISNHIFSVLMLLLKRPVEHLTHMTMQLSLRMHYVDEDAIDLWDDIPPVDVTTLENGRSHFDYVITPGQIVDSGAYLGLPDVYGLLGHDCNWVLETGQTKDDAIQAAKQRYMVQPNPDAEDLFAPSSDSDCDTLTEPRDDGSYSEYDDEECPDGVVDLVPFSWMRNTVNENNMEEEDYSDSDEMDEMEVEDDDDD